MVFCFIKEQGNQKDNERCLIDAMITTKDLYDILENKISNEVQKAFIRNNFPPHIAEKMCAAIDDQEKAEHLRRLLIECNEYQQKQQATILEFLKQYYK